MARRVLTQEQLQRWGATLKRTYGQVLDLHRRGWNGVWFRIVRSFFRSAGAGRFDVIVGNPPWVRWSKLPESYRERAKPTCEQYAIFSETPHHGGNELDISGMITYTTADKWLKPGGTLAFVITQTHFQSPSSHGFRRFRIGPGEFLAPSSVDDLATLKPFPDAANKTSVAVFRKGAAAPRYPVSYRRWAPSRSSRAIPANLSLPQVMERLEVHECEAHPVDGEGSPWAILPPGRFGAVARLRGRSPGVRGRKGITTDLNAVYFVNVDAVNGNNGLVRVTTRPETGKTEIGGARSFWIEPTLLYPLLKGAADFETCYTKPRHRLFAFVPNHGIRQQDHREAEEHMARSCPRTEDYFRAYERWLRKRSTWRGRMPGAPFYAVYNVGRYTFAPYKVLWAEQSRTFKAAVATGAETPLVGHRPYVPDHKIFFVEFADAAPAYFLCGLLSSSLVREFVESHTIAIQVGNIFKHMRLPSFDPSVEDHELLSDLVERAHGGAQRGGAARACAGRTGGCRPGARELDGRADRRLRQARINARCRRFASALPSPRDLMARWLGTPVSRPAQRPLRAATARCHLGPDALAGAVAPSAHAAVTRSPAGGGRCRPGRSPPEGLAGRSKRSPSSGTAAFTQQLTGASGKGRFCLSPTAESGPRSSHGCPHPFPSPAARFTGTLPPGDRMDAVHFDYNGSPPSTPHRRRHDLRPDRPTRQRRLRPPLRSPAGGVGRHPADPGRCRQGDVTVRLRGHRSTIHPGST